MHRALFLVAIGVVFCIAAAAIAANSPTLPDLFATEQGWQVEATDDISSAMHATRDGGGRGLCMAFNFNGVSGGATLERSVAIDWPANFALSFDVRGTMPANDLQIKLIDASGDNVWWYRQQDFQPSSGWQRIVIPSTKIDFAWGPSADRALRRTAKLAFTAHAGHGGQGELCFRHVRLQSLSPDSTSVAAAAPSTAATPDAFFQQQARQAPRGLYPRGYTGEQSYWTLVGTDGGAKQSALISEDGAVEVRRGGWSIEPMLLDRGRLIDWASVQITQSLQDGYLPIPTVHWRAAALTLDTTAIASGDATDTQLLVRYVLRNTSDSPRAVTLALLARPFQVNPSTQFLNTAGGSSPIHDLDWNGHALQVNHDLSVVPLQDNARFAAETSAAAASPSLLLHGASPMTNHLHDEAGFAQAALLYDVTIPAHAQRVFGVAVPSAAQTFSVSASPLAWLQQQNTIVANVWREKLNRVTVTLPPAQQALVDTARSAIAQILMSRGGAALQPGTRSYGRSWIRDGAMMAEGLLRSGHANVVADFVRWYAPHQFHNGKIPCCVDARGSDPVPENDSQGEWIFAVGELWRYRGDRAEIESLWPHVQRAVAYMDTLRASEQHDADPALRGLMPASISHEGYSAKPMHSYWDDFWSLIGYNDAVTLAQAVGKPDEATRIGQSRDAFRADLLASILASVAQHRIDYLPGAAELGDFDATASTVALSPGDGVTWLPPPLLTNTFERYWQGFVRRREGSIGWDDYTPYEVRTVASFVRLGWRDRVGALLDFFMASRRPAAWNQWAEVVGHDPRKPRFVGDMPHAWIASDYLRSVYDMFAYERESDHALVLAAGLDPRWFAGESVGIARLRTPYGELSYRLQRQGDRLQLTIPATLRLPPGGLVFPWPYAQTPHRDAMLNGKPVAWQKGEVNIRQLPATLTMGTP